MECSRHKRVLRIFVPQEMSRVDNVKSGTNSGLPHTGYAVQDSVEMRRRWDLGAKRVNSHMTANADCTRERNESSRRVIWTEGRGEIGRLCQRGLRCRVSVYLFRLQVQTRKQNDESVP